MTEHIVDEPRRWYNPNTAACTRAERRFAAALELASVLPTIAKHIAALSDYEIDDGEVSITSGTYTGTDDPKGLSELVCSIVYDDVPRGDSAVEWDREADDRRSALARMIKAEHERVDRMRQAPKRN